MLSHIRMLRAALATVVAGMLLASCTAPPSGGPSVQADAAHSQLNGASAPKYVVAATNTFSLDTSQIKFEDRIDLASAPKLVRFQIDKAHSYTLLYKPNKTVYPLKAEDKFKPGQEVTVSIVYACVDNEKKTANFVPIWTGIIQIK